VRKFAFFFFAPFFLSFLPACTPGWSSQNEAESEQLRQAQLARDLEKHCLEKLAFMFGDSPRIEVVFTGKTPVTRPMPPIFSKKFDEQYYDLWSRTKSLKSEMDFDLVFQKEKKLSDELASILAGTEFRKTCVKVTQKIAAECVKYQPKKHELDKCTLFHQPKFDILYRHNRQVMHIPAQRQEIAKLEKWLEE
jgi:hypothetical protein